MAVTLPTAALSGCGFGSLKRETEETRNDFLVWVIVHGNDMGHLSWVGTCPRWKRLCVSLRVGDEERRVGGKRKTKPPKRRKQVTTSKGCNLPEAYVTCIAASLDQPESKMHMTKIFDNWQLFLFDYKNSLRPLANNTSTAGQAWGGSFKEKNISQRKNLPIECAQGDQPLRLQPFHGGDVVTCFDVVGCRVRWGNVVGCEVTWGEVMWLVARYHVMWCDVVSCHLMWCDFLCGVLSRDAMWCHVMCSHAMSVICCEVMRRNGMRPHEFVMRCGWLRCHVV